jgi:hypothetical protein
MINFLSKVGIVAGQRQSAADTIVAPTMSRLRRQAGEK